MTDVNWIFCIRKWEYYLKETTTRKCFPIYHILKKKQIIENEKYRFTGTKYEKKVIYEKLSCDRLNWDNF